MIGSRARRHHRPAVGDEGPAIRQEGDSLSCPG
jgi:hypothetical protein